MTSDKYGAVTGTLQVATNAKHVSCYKHALNNSTSKSSKVQSVRNTTAIMEEIVAFFNQSAMRNSILKSHVGSQLCKEAALYTNSVCSTEFIFALISLIGVLKHTLPLSRHLQSPTLDLKGASDAVQDTLVTLHTLRQDSGKNFLNCIRMLHVQLLSWELTSYCHALLQGKLHRAYYDSNSVEEYYGKSTYIPLLDNVLTDLEQRFLQNMVSDSEVELPQLSWMLKCAFGRKSGRGSVKKVTHYHKLCLM
ncbi:hypothetical protein PR048_000505 [Dryococelus australis]|uniref:Uncharacterized protein n=1 Tax=Dryococelus australis TaxID=614101 RepID=A0ABQ9IG56_9NEOP|nr:hypothetical protein PR048_000505 [Dryococelus australis]